jgi:thiamine kinase-like enzyme
MPQRRDHQQEVYAFLHRNLSNSAWKFSLPHGSGRESYFAHGYKRSYFVKIGVQVERYLAMAEIGLAPPVILHGQLDSGPSVMVQLFMEGRRPSRTDYHNCLTDVAQLVKELHNNVRIRDIVQAASSNLYQDAGKRALECLRQKWERFRVQAPGTAEFIDTSLDHLAQQVGLFSGEGLVASHGDICNANWLFTTDGKIYILDFESMSMDDPAADMGALLWWYYPPELRQRFLDIAGYHYDEEFRFRMQVRMAMHCLSIILPREDSFDTFNAEEFSDSLRDFRAVLDGKENPEGYIK